MSAAAEDAPQQGGTLLGTLYNWGGNVLGYASQQLNSFLGWEDLDVVDPEADTAVKGGAKAEEGVLKNERKQAWGTRQFQQYIGMDVTSLLSVPVWIMEPMTILQKAAEIMEYTDLLDSADQAEDPWDRFALVAAYAVSPFGANERAWKPFNPILGETFELDINNGVKYMSEQVSHHPPVCAGHAENAHFVYDLVSAPTTRFLGNSLEIFPYGRTRIQLRRTKELYTLTPPNATVNNIVIGRTWVDATGQMSIYCSTTGAKCLIDFTPCGWFSYGRYEINGYVYDPEGNKRVKLSGKWNSHVDAVRCDFDGQPREGEEVRRLWTCAPKPQGDYYSFTHFAHKLNSCEGIKAPLPSDSRRRPDRSALARGEMTAAGVEKYRLEEMQRAERRERESRGDSWEPRWFKKADTELLPGEYDTEKVPIWEWSGHELFERKPEAATAEQIDGREFSPWQYPEIHDEDGEQPAQPQDGAEQ